MFRNGCIAMLVAGLVWGCKNQDFRSESTRGTLGRNGASTVAPGTSPGGNSQNGQDSDADNDASRQNPRTDGGQNSRTDRDSDSSDGRDTDKRNSDDGGSDDHDGPNILPWVIGVGAAAVIAGLILGNTGKSCKDSEATARRSTDPAKSIHLSPFDLTVAGYRGQLGIGGYGLFCSKYREGKLSADDVVEVGIYRGVVRRSLANCAYRNAVKLQMRATCNG